MKSIALLEYTFMFDPSETWSHMYEFENNFAAFLDAQGLEAQLVPPIGQSTKKVIFITKKPELAPVEPPQNNPRDQVKELKKGLK